MPRYLTIDGKADALHVLAVHIHRGRSRVEQAVSVPLSEPLVPASAAALGRRLKDALAGAGVAPAPVLFAVGRDRVVLKEFPIPHVDDAEEPMVVRFQAAKEISEPQPDVVFDYVRMSPPRPGQPSPIQIAVVRRSIVMAATALCQSAGLKLHAVVPRPHAIAGLLARIEKPGETPAILIPGEAGEVDLSVFDRDQVVWARSLPAGPELAGELRRNRMLLSAQKTLDVGAIFTAGVRAGDIGDSAVELDPWRDGDARPQNPADFLVPLGLAELAARRDGLPINLADPKEPKPVVNVARQRLRIASLAAAVLIPILIAGWWWKLSATRAEIRELQVAKEDLDDQWKRLEQERLDVAALKEWEQTTISWLDELYSVSARLPHAQGFRLAQVSATQVRRRGAKDAATGLLTLHGIMNSDQDVLVNQFLESLHEDKYLKAQSPTFRGNDFTIKIDVAPRPPMHHTTQLVVPPRPKTASAALSAAPPTPTPADPLEGLDD